MWAEILIKLNSNERKFAANDFFLSFKAISFSDISITFFPIENCVCVYRVSEENLKIELNFMAIDILYIC